MSHLQVIAHQPPVQFIARSRIVFPSSYQPLLAVVILKLKAGQSCSDFLASTLLLLFFFTNQPWSLRLSFAIVFFLVRVWWNPSCFAVMPPRCSCPLSTAAMVLQALIICAYRKFDTKVILFHSLQLYAVLANTCVFLDGWIVWTKAPNLWRWNYESSLDIQISFPMVFMCIMVLMTIYS